MMWIKCLAFIGVVAVVCAKDDDIYCYSKAMSTQCSTADYAINSCSATSYLANCVNNCALSCSMANDKDIKSLTAFLTDMCTEGTNNNKAFKQYWPCAVQSISSSGCNADFQKALVNLNKRKLPFDKTMREAYKLGCQFNNSVATCNLLSIKSKCGLDAENWVRKQQNAGSNQLAVRLCNYVNGVERNYFRLPMWVLQAIILVFVYKWSSY